MDVSLTALFCVPILYEILLETGCNTYICHPTSSSVATKLVKFLSPRNAKPPATENVTV